MCNGIPVFAIADLGEQNPMAALQKFLYMCIYIYIYIYINMASAYFTINCKSHQNAHAWFYVNKIDWL